MKHNAHGIDAFDSSLADSPAEDAVYAIPIPHGIKHIADIAVWAMINAASLSKSNFLYSGTRIGNVIRYAGVKFPVKIANAAITDVRIMITITFILSPSLFVTADTMVSNTPASVSIWKYRNANNNMNPADLMIDPN